MTLSTKRIFKYEVQPPGGKLDDNQIDMPSGAKILHVAAVGGLEGGIYLWAIVEPDAPVAHRSIAVYPTGLEPLSEEALAGTYLGTVHLGPLVFHLFDLGEQPG